MHTIILIIYLLVCYDIREKYSKKSILLTQYSAKILDFFCIVLDLTVLKKTTCSYIMLLH